MTKTPPRVVKAVVRARWRHRLGPVQIGGRLGMPASTAHAVLTRCRINRLSRIDRVTGEPLRRYEHDHPGSLIHVDVTKFATIPDGGGHKFLTRQQGRANAIATAARTGKRGDRSQPLIGTAFVHNVIDDHSRAAYAEICTNEKADTAIAVLRRATALVRRPRRHRRTGPVRQQLGLLLPRLARRLHRPQHQTQADPPLPPPD